MTTYLGQPAGTVPGGEGRVSVSSGVSRQPALALSKQMTPLGPWLTVWGICRESGEGAHTQVLMSRSQIPFKE